MKRKDVTSYERVCVETCLLGDGPGRFVKLERGKKYMVSRPRHGELTVFLSGRRVFRAPAALFEGYLFGSRRNRKSDGPMRFDAAMNMWVPERQEAA